MLIEEKKKIYDLNPEKWIVYCKWEHKSKLTYKQIREPGISPFIGMGDPSHIYLIDKDDEYIADAVIANPDVEVEFKSQSSVYFIPLTKTTQFFENYSPNWKYRLAKPQCDSKFNGGYIKASQEAYNLLVKSGYPDASIIDLPFDKNYLLVTFDGFIISQNIGITLKQFYINSGKLSWEESKYQSETWGDFEMPSALVTLVGGYVQQIKQLNLFEKQFPKPKEKPKKYKNPICRGCWTLGTACGYCERCIETKPKDNIPKELTYKLLGLVVDEKFCRIDHVHNNQVCAVYAQAGVYYCQLDTLTKKMKEWCLKQKYQIESAINTNGGYAHIYDSETAFNVKSIMTVKSEFEAVLKATEWAAKEKGLL